METGTLWLHFAVSFQANINSISKMIKNCKKEMTDQYTENIHTEILNIRNWMQWLIKKDNTL